MSNHKTPLTKLEKDGLIAHGLGRYIGKPSQLADVFRQGVAWALAHYPAPTHQPVTDLGADNTPKSTETRINTGLAGGGQVGVKQAVEPTKQCATPEQCKNTFCVPPCPGCNSTKQAAQPVRSPDLSDADMDKLASVVNQIDAGAKGWHELMDVALAIASAAPAQRPLTDDTQRLNALAENSWDLRCFETPTGADDADIGWRVVEHHMETPTERTVAEVFRDNPRQAIDAAIQAVNGIKVKHGREAQQSCRVDCGECPNVTSGCEAGKCMKVLAK
jgi:hypothetical protein